MLVDAYSDDSEDEYAMVARRARDPDDELCTNCNRTGHTRGKCPKPCRIPIGLTDARLTCNGIAPCYVFSPMIMEQLSAEKRAELLDMIPVKKFCTPEEVAHTTNFLVSPLAGFITGEIIDQNGGFQMD